LENFIAVCGRRADVAAVSSVARDVQ